MAPFINYVTQKGEGGRQLYELYLTAPVKLQHGSLFLFCLRGAGKKNCFVLLQKSEKQCIVLFFVLLTKEPFVNNLLTQILRTSPVSIVARPPDQIYMRFELPKYFFCSVFVEC